MLATFRDILTQDIEDSVAFDPDTLRIYRIREELDYGGLRLRAMASIGGARPTHEKARTSGAARPSAAKAARTGSAYDPPRRGGRERR